MAYYSRKFKKPKRAVYFPYEQTFLVETKKTLNSSDYNGHYFRSDIYLAFPGLFKNHSIRTKFRYEMQKHIHALQMRVKELADENYELRKRINGLSK